MKKKTEYNVKIASISDGQNAKKGNHLWLITTNTKIKQKQKHKRTTTGAHFIQKKATPEASEPATINSLAENR